jgi:hypothetical protein
VWLASSLLQVTQKRAPGVSALESGQGRQTCWNGLRASCVSCGGGPVVMGRALGAPLEQAWGQGVAVLPYGGGLSAF